MRVILATALLNLETPPSRIVRLTLPGAVGYTAVTVALSKSEGAEPESSLGNPLSIPPEKKGELTDDYFAGTPGHRRQRRRR